MSLLLKEITSIQGTTAQPLKKKKQASLCIWYIASMAYSNNDENFCPQNPFLPLKIVADTEEKF